MPFVLTSLYAKRHPGAYRSGMQTSGSQLLLGCSQSHTLPQHDSNPLIVRRGLRIGILRYNCIAAECLNACRLVIITVTGSSVSGFSFYLLLMWSPTLPLWTRPLVFNQSFWCPSSDTAEQAPSLVYPTLAEREGARERLAME